MIVRRIPWETEHCKKLARAAGNQAELEYIQAEVESGISELWQCQSDTASGYVVTRFESPAEWVIVLGQGSGFKEFVPVFINHARAKGWTIRTHVKRPGLIRMWERLGIHLEEYVLRG